MESVVILLTWTWARSVEDPYIKTGQVLTVIYFSYFLTLPQLSMIWDFLLTKKN